MDSINNYLLVFWRILVATPLFLIYLTSGLIPKSNNLWIFGSWEGEHYRGNSKLFFLYMCKYHQEIRCAWITKSPSLYKKLNLENVPIYYAYSFKGIIINALAKYIFVSHDVCDVNQYFTRKAIIFDLSHATCPIKKMGYSSKYDSYYRPDSIKRKLFNIITNPYGYIKPNFVITASKFTAKIFKSIYNVESKQLITLGVPKTDYLLENSDKINNKLDIILNGVINNISYDNIILFLPTFRNNPDYDLLNFGFDPDALENFLESSKTILLLNLHPFDKKRLNNISLKRYKRIILLNMLGDELNLMLRKASIFITDYSSLWADYLLYDRPIIFSQYDHENYLLERELYSYTDELPGYKVKDWPDLIDKMSKILVDNNDIYNERRLIMREKIYNYRDGKSCSRLYDFVNQLK